MTARASRLAVDRRRIPDTLARLASALVLCDRRYHQDLEQAIVTQSGLEPIMYLENVSYGETPMQTRTEQVEWSIVDKSSGAESGQMAAHDNKTLDIKKVVRGVDTGPSTLFQTASSTTMLAKKAATEHEPEEFFLVVGRPTPWIQFIETSSAEVLKAAIRECSAVSVAAGAFAFKVRAATSDRLAANLKPERQTSRCLATCTAPRVCSPRHSTCSGPS